MVQVVTGDSQEEVMIFRDKQTHTHCIIIYISSSSSSSLVASEKALGWSDLIVGQWQTLGGECNGGQSVSQRSCINNVM